MEIQASANSNYNNASGTVVDTITPSHSKVVTRVVMLPKTTMVKATELVPVIKNVPTIVFVRVGNRMVKETKWVPHTVMSKITVTVPRTQMVRTVQQVKVYYV